jgi:hypothetical protein
MGSRAEGSFFEIFLPEADRPATMKPTTGEPTNFPRRALAWKDQKRRLPLVCPKCFMLLEFGQVLNSKACRQCGNQTFFGRIQRLIGNAVQF